MCDRCICDDVDCKFKHTTRVDDKVQDECSLALADAIMFWDLYKFTTCEVGMGEKIIKTPQITKALITKLKYAGRM